ncbi:MAG TPA: hypothetical protein VNS58_13915 [Puia sp.]|nr:hypothetical protein [Puia sp.]
MENKKTEIVDQTIFFSWQSDISPESNTNAIRNSLRECSANIEAEMTNVHIKLDEATRNTTGSPDIPATIFDKIPSADIFICDITTINSNSKDTPKKSPNPNVLIELGYASAMVGWDRIIMLFNKSFGEFPAEVPFDIDRRRITPYSVNDKKDKIGKKELQLVLEIAIKAIIKDNPLRPFDKRKLSPQQIKRNKDISNLKWLFNSIHIPSMDEFIEELPNIVIHRITHFWEGFRAIYKSNLYNIYDISLSQRIEAVFRHWDIILSFWSHYRASLSGNQYIFGSPNDMRTSKEEKAFKKIMKERQELYASFRDLLQYIRTEFIEIDLDETSSNAWKEYVEFYKD